MEQIKIQEEKLKRDRQEKSQKCFKDWVKKKNIELRSQNNQRRRFNSSQFFNGSFYGSQNS